MAKRMATGTAIARHNCPGSRCPQAGYTLVPATTTLPPGTTVPLRFTIQGPDGKPVTQYTRDARRRTCT